jgi:hypothetical protein
LNLAYPDGDIPLFLRFLKKNAAEMRQEENESEVVKAAPSPNDRMSQWIGASGSPACGIPVWAIATLRWTGSKTRNDHQ